MKLLEDEYVPSTTALWELISIIDVDSQELVHATSKEAESFDLVLVFDAGTEQIMTYKGEFWVKKDLFAKLIAIVVQKIKAAGVTVLMYYSKSRDKIFCLLGASENRLSIEADRIEYELELDPESTLQYGLARNVRLAVAVTEPEDPLNKAITPDSFYNLFGKFARKNPAFPGREKLYKRYDDQGSRHPNAVFRSVDRIKLLLSLIEARINVGGAGLNLAKELTDVPLLTFFPLHEENKRLDLWDSWSTYNSLWNCPLEQIRNYYGEEVTFFFAFLNFYTRWISIPAIIGLIIYINGSYNQTDSGLLFFGVFMSVWSTYFLYSWRRRQYKNRLLWGMSNFSVTEQPRPGFSGYFRRAPTNGKLEITSSLFGYIVRTSISFIIILIMMGIIVAATIGIFLLRSTFNVITPTYAGTIVGILNSLLIQIFNLIYEFVAAKLTDFENHRTQTSYRNNLIAKRFVAKFVSCILSQVFTYFISAYTVLVYILFFKKNDVASGGCIEDNCINDLRLQLITSFITSTVVGNALEIILPFVESRRRFSITPGKTPPENEYELNEFLSTIDDYDDMFVSWGYMILMVVVFPLLPLMAFGANFIEVRVATYKIVKYARRCIPRSADDIGSWIFVFEIVSWIALVSNLYICTYYTNELALSSDSFKTWVFFILVNGVIALKAFFFTLPPIGQDVEEAMKRTKYLCTVLIDGAKEEEEVEFNEAAANQDAKSLLEYNLDLPIIQEDMPMSALHG